ncbi:PleD family two-component system response regulator [Leptothoe spongobia]|uniref:Response regulator n=1 Tax=Leptothoe spongobia TAU-MAC 1115 TaxID=1967444 RepID=A0A947DIS5_9CYAN|nr:hypothetical protein [Leptothoe spongobia]MBT9317404.1 hypothetical protein [Leptothoe spongobia TAU-MAC 1115]
MKAIAIVGNTDQSQTLLADLLHWHGLSAFQVDEGKALLPLLSFISPELIVIESSGWVDAEVICSRIKRSPVLKHVPVIICADRADTVGHADAYVSSPYTAEEVFANVQALRPMFKPLSSDSVVARLDS